MWLDDEVRYTGSMNRKAYYLGLLGVVIIVLIGAVFVMGASNLQKGEQKKTENESSKQNSTTQSDEVKKETELKPEATPQVAGAEGLYTGYNEQAFTDATSKTRVLFFHAPWCPQCRSLDESIKKQQLPDNLVIFKVDYDTNQALRQKYGVTLQTTFVRVDDKGEKVKSIVAYSNPVYSTVKNELGL